jgi:hypothetical protein
MLRLLAIVAGLVLAALLLLTRHGAHGTAAALAPGAASDVRAQEPAQPPLDLVPESEDSRQGAGGLPYPRVIGQLRFQGDLADLEGSVVFVSFEDYHDSPLAAEEAHLRAGRENDARRPLPSQRTTRVRRDGWWAVELPGRSWVRSALIEPMRRSTKSPAGSALTWRPAIRSRAEIDHPLESGKLQVLLIVDPGMTAQGLVLDAETQAPLAQAQVAILTRGGPLNCCTDERGAFQLAGIDPRELQPVDGCIKFMVIAPQYAGIERKVPWEEGQDGIVAFRTLLQKNRTGRR